MQVAGEGGVEGVVEGDFAALETLEGPVGRGGGDAGVYPAWRDALAEFIV